MNNNSSNDRLLDEEEVQFWRHPFYLTFVYLVAYSLVFVVGVLGNSLVIVVFVVNPALRVTTTYLITSLALADLLVVLFCLPTTLTNNILIQWYFGQLFCKMSVWINSTSVCVSVYTMVAVALDRYFAICHPVRYSRFAPKKTLLGILPIWLFSSMLFSSDLIFYDTILYKHGNWPTLLTICVPDFPSKFFVRVYFVLVNVVCAFLIPLTVISACYTYIYCNYVQKPSSSSSNNTRLIAIRSNSSTVKQNRAQRVKMKITRMMVLVVVLFTCSWLPFYAFFAYMLYGGGDLGRNWVKVVRALIQWLTLANSCLNPTLYAYFSSTYRRAFMQILLFCRLVKKSSRHSTRSKVNSANKLDEKSRCRKTEANHRPGRSVIT